MGHAEIIDQLGRRAHDTMDGYEMLVDATMRAKEEFDTLGLETFRQHNGVFVCIGSRILSSEHHISDELAVDGTELQRNRRYPQMTAQAHIVGLWRRADTAALYTVNAPFVIPAQEATADFATAVSSVVENDRYPSYVKLEDATEGVTLYGKESRARVVGTEATKIRTRKYGELDDEVGLAGSSIVAGPE